MDSDQLKQLASSLGECSKIVNEILCNSNEQPRESTSSNSSPSIVDSNTVASTVGRVQLMLQRSTVAGLCSRLNQRERLRASPRSASAIGSSEAKKPRKRTMLTSSRSLLSLP